MFFDIGSHNTVTESRFPCEPVGSNYRTNQSREKRGQNTVVDSFLCGLLDRFSEELLDYRLFGVVEDDARRRLADTEFVGEVGERTGAWAVVVSACERFSGEPALPVGQQVGPVE